MAPSQSPQMVIGRKRARPATPQGRALLREDVLELIHKTKAPIIAQQRRLESQYDAAWRAFCGKMRQADDEDGSDAASAVAWDRLAQALTTIDTSVDALVVKIARSVCVSCSSSGDRHLRMLLQWTWRGHINPSGSLWRIQDVLRSVASIASEEIVSHWLGVALRSLVSPIAASSMRSQGQRILTYLVRIAFTSPNPNPTDTDNPISSLTSTSEDDAPQLSSLSVVALVRQALVGLCSPPKVNGPFSVLTKVSDTILACLADHTDHPAITADLQAFLRSQVKRLLLGVTSDESPIDEGHDHILTVFQSCVLPSNAVQLFRQVWTEASTTTSGSGPTSIERLSPLLASCARRDVDFQAHALAAAHDLAHDAITASSAVHLRQSLDLAAAVTTSESDEASEESPYHEWFRGHFAALDAQSSSSLSGGSEKSRLSIASNSGAAAHSCLRARGGTPTNGAASSSSPVCSLVSTKRHLEFVCAFLMEYDRVESVGRRAHHVLAHLSAIKTHQATSGSAVAGLLSDFCSQTRARYVELLAKEQASRARLRRRSSSSANSLKISASSASTMSQATPASSQYTTGTRAIVEELLELFAKDRTALVTQVNQWKLFKQQQWKQQILPCCLDVFHWQGAFHFQESPDQDTDLQKSVQSKKRVTELVSFVQVLAKHHAVGTQDYMVFIKQVESWLESQQGAAKQATQTSSRRQHLGETGVSTLKDALDSFFDHSHTGSDLSVRVRDQTWSRVAEMFVNAFEDLTGLQVTDQEAQIRAIWELVVWRCAVNAAESDAFTLEACVEQHLSLWFTLLSRDATSGASPEERHQAMETYCRVAVQRVGEMKAGGDEGSEEHTHEIAVTLTGTLLGLLASLVFCESIAVSSTHAMNTFLASSTANTSTDTVQTKLLSAFLSGFLAGFMKNPTDNAPQLVLQSVLPASMRESLVWVGHFTRVWWMNDFQHSQTSPASDRLWRFVGRTVQAVYDQHAWFRLTLSPGVLTTKAQWQDFFERELTCCALELLVSSPPRVDVVPFVNVQREQIVHLLFSSSAGLSAGVQVSDVCTWISRVTLALAASSSSATSRASALDALVWLLRDVSSLQLQETSQTASPTASDPLAFVLDTVASSSLESSDAREMQVRYSLRCVQVILDSSSLAKSARQTPPQVIKTFLDRVAEVMDATPHSVPFEWICSLWCIVTRLPQRAEVYSSAAHIPPAIFAHWAFEFARLCRFLQPKKNGKAAHASQMALLKSVQTGYDFYRTLGVRRLQAPTTSMSVIGLSASQYVPSSVAEESLQLHVRSLEWLVAKDLLPTSLVLPSLANLSIPDLKTSLSFHETATRVLTALLEDLALGRPDDVATELTESCQASWMASVSPETRKPDPERREESSFKFQLLLVHMVSELAARHASVGRFLLRSSSELLADPRRGFFLFLLLFVSNETEHIDSILAHNGSLWVNTFAEVACSLADISTAPLPEPTAGSVSIVTLLQPFAGFQSQLSSVVSRVLGFAASRQIDLLDAAVLQRMETLFPTLADLLARVPVLNLASEAYFTEDF